MKIGILGGAFDPPHRGHTLLAVALKTFFDEIWILPAYDHMHGKKMESAADRLEMCNIAFNGYSKIRISDYEIANKIADGTLSLMQKLGKSFPQHQFCFIIGQDNANTIEKWKNYKQLLLSTTFFVVPREGYPLNKDPSAWYSNKPHHYLQEKILLPKVSSTEVREKLLKNEKSEYLDNLVFDFIKRKNLYKAQNVEL